MIDIIDDRTSDDGTRQFLVIFSGFENFPEWIDESLMSADTMIAEYINSKEVRVLPTAITAPPRTIRPHKRITLHLTPAPQAACTGCRRRHPHCIGYDLVSLFPERRQTVL